MASIGLVIAVGGSVVALVGFVSFLIQPFKQSIFWGCGVLLFPLIAFVFVILHPKKAGWHLIVYVFGCVLMGVGVAMMQME